MNPPPVPEEPLNNIDLESAILGMKMALTPEEEVEAREKFLTQLAMSTLVVPTVNPVQTAPDGSIAPNADITFVVVESKDGGSGIPAFTSLGYLKQSLPNVNNGIFLNGAQIAGIVASSPHKLYVDGPDMHAEVEKEELAEMAQAAQQAVEMQQQAANHNEPLEAALAEFKSSDSEATREAIKMAFLSGFCRIPVARDVDQNAKCVVMRTGNPQDEAAQQQIPLLTENDELLCFSSEDELKKWNDAERNAVALPGPMICDMVVQTGIGKLRVNTGSENSVSVQLEPPNRFTIL
jgi:hypothetical protein